MLIVLLCFILICKREKNFVFKMLWFVIFVGLLGVIDRSNGSFDNLVYMEKDLSGLLGTRAAGNSEEAACFHFTWLGRDYDNGTASQFVDKTCSEIFAMRRPEPLCVDPVVGTVNATPPDLDYIYMNHYQAATCTLHPGSVCAKFSYIFNGVVQNVTRYCTKVTVDDVEMKSGCIQDSRGAYTTEICACETATGNFPCNTGYSINSLTINFLHLVIAFLSVKLLV